MANIDRPWHRLDGETDAPFRAFNVFLKLPAPRSLQACSDATRGIVGPGRGYSYGTLEQWSSAWEWFARASAYDDWLLEREHSGMARAAADKGARLARKHMRVGKELINWGRRGMLALPPEVASPNALLRAQVEGFKIERLVTGEATERVEEKTTDLSKLSDAQLAELEKLMKITRGE